MKPHTLHRLKQEFPFIKHMNASKGSRRYIHTACVLLQRLESEAKKTNRAERRLTSEKRLGKPRRKFRLVQS